MVVTVTIDSTYKKLTDDPSNRIKAGGVGREREAIVNIAISAETPGAGGLVTVDFSGIAPGFKQVYSCDIIHSDLDVLASYVPATGNDSATGQLHLVDFTGADVGVSTTTNFRVAIRGV